MVSASVIETFLAFLVFAVAFANKVATLTPSNDTSNPAATAKTCGKTTPTTGSNLDTLSMCVCLGGR